jgi:hypothetical protein
MISIWYVEAELDDRLVEREQLDDKKRMLVGNSLTGKGRLPCVSDLGCIKNVCQITMTHELLLFKHNCFSLISNGFLYYMAACSILNQFSRFILMQMYVSGF